MSIKVSPNHLQNIPIMPATDALCPALPQKCLDGFDDIAQTGLNLVAATIEYAPESNQSALREHLLEASQAVMADETPYVQDEMWGMRCTCDSTYCEHAQISNAATIGLNIAAGALAASRLFETVKVSKGDYSAGGMPWIFRSANIEVPPSLRTTAAQHLNSYLPATVETMLRVPSQSTDRPALYMGFAAQLQPALPAGMQSTSLAVEVHTEQNRQSIRIERNDRMGNFVLSSSPEQHAEYLLKGYAKVIRAVIDSRQQES
ncbi:MAG TPA: hypothetical protein VFI74_06125 [Candidatus Saccharimonadales bacterium]|nr:hypothetical protein [Candidatus Saccharimonadales bacterium]